MSAEIHVGDIGTALRATIRNQDNEIVDLSTFSSLQFKLLKPGRTTETYTASFYTDGTDGVMQYVTTTSDVFDQAGIYRLQGIVVFASGDTHKSDIVAFKVEPNI